MTQTTKVQKTADLRFITTLRNKPYIRVYLYRSSDDTKDYQVTTIHGKVSSCNTPATQPCYICKDAQRREDERDQDRSNFNNYELSLGIM